MPKNIPKPIMAIEDIMETLLNNLVFNNFRATLDIKDIIKSTKEIPNKMAKL